MTNATHDATETTGAQTEGGDHERIADEIEGSDTMIRAAIYVESDDRYAIFSRYDRLEPKTLGVLAENGLQIHPQKGALIQYSHPEIKNERGEAYKATFTATEADS